VEFGGRVAEIKHGAAIIATGAEVSVPTEYLYGEDERVMTHLELEEKIAAGDERVTGAESLVMIQCVGCRNEDRNYCSRVCCSESIKNALKLKEINPKMDIYILFRDMRTYGSMRIITVKRRIKTSGSSAMSPMNNQRSSLRKAKKAKIF
jgi:heterodisulfide reductase subunit A